MKQLIFLGAPGSGKGTQAKVLVEKKNYNHVSTGDLLRGEIKKGTELGQKVDNVLKSGDLVKDELVLELLKANCDLSTGAYIFDGFPRNIEQSKLLEDHILGDFDYSAVYFNMPTETLVERLTARRTCKDCNAVYNIKFLPPKQDGICDKCGGNNLFQRDDDKEEVIRKRMEVYGNTIGPVLEHYKSGGRLVEIDASLPMKEVTEELLGYLG